MTIELKLDDDTKQQSVEAGFATVQEYLYSLLQRDRNRLEILKGLQDVEAGNVRSFEKFDREFRSKHGIDQNN